MECGIVPPLLKAPFAIIFAHVLSFYGLFFKSYKIWQLSQPWSKN